MKTIQILSLLFACSALHAQSSKMSTGKNTAEAKTTVSIPEAAPEKQIVRSSTAKSIAAEQKTETADNPVADDGPAKSATIRATRQKAEKGSQILQEIPKSP
jgi:hypothetical protein